jgi:ubiquinone/menaquinone biosynthesis C-methylase UbiE
MIFDFNLVADYYDEYYNSNFGRKVDFVEKRRVKKFIEQIPIKSALEIGCGTGHWTQFFIDNGFRLTAIDVSENMINKAREKNLNGVEFSIKNIEEIDYPDNYFENVFAITSLEFVDNRGKAFEQIYRILKPGGYLLIGCLNINSYLGKTKNSNKVFKNANFFDEKQLQEILSKFGIPQIGASALITENSDEIASQEYLLSETKFKPSTEKNIVLDYERDVDNDYLLREGAFLVGFVQKKV